MAVEGKPMDCVGMFAARMDDFYDGRSIRIAVCRDGKRRQVAVTVQPGN